MLLYTFGSAMCSFIVFLFRTECQASRISLCRHANDLSTDKIEKEASRGIVSKIKCKDCDCVYVGQTSRALKTRVKEHAKAIATLDKNSLLAKHHILTVIK